jgi:hypothetical protein
MLRVQSLFQGFLLAIIWLNVQGGESIVEQPVQASSP